MSPNDVFDRKKLSEVVVLAAQCVALKEGGPFATIITLEGKEIARGWNSVPSHLDPTAHGEIVAIRKACKTLGEFHLQGCVLYSSCEPCPMCWGAIQWARIIRVVYAASQDDAASVGFDDRAFHQQMTIPVSQRTPPAVCYPLPDKLAPFRCWHAMSDRIHY